MKKTFEIDPILFTLPLYDYLADSLRTIPDISQGRYRCERFGDGEMAINVLRDVVGNNCIILSTLMPPDYDIIETLLLAHTLKKEGAKDVVLVAPYLSYMRQDRDESGKSLAAAWVADLTKSSGIDRIVTFDVHSQFAQSLFGIPIMSLPPYKAFMNEIDLTLLENTTLIAPDEGAIHRCKLFNQELSLNLPVSYFEKEHYREEVTPHLIGELTPDVILVDDILDTGTTLISACRALKDRKVQNITIIVTHGLFINPLWEDLWELNVSDIFVTDTVPISKNTKAKGVTVCSIAPILKEYMENNL